MSRTMASYTINDVAILASIFVLVQLCFVGNPAVAASENKITWSSSSDSVLKKSQNGAERITNLLSKRMESAELKYTRRTCPNLSLPREMIMFVKKRMCGGKRCMRGPKPSLTKKRTTKGLRRSKKNKSDPRKGRKVDFLGKRPSIPVKCTPGEKRCCWQPTVVNLKRDLFSSVIAPESFRTGYCRGSCKDQSRGRRSRPCCVATKTTPLTVIHSDLKTNHSAYRGRKPVYISKFEDVVIQECGCR